MVCCEPRGERGRIGRELREGKGSEDQQTDLNVRQEYHNLLRRGRELGKGVTTFKCPEIEQSCRFFTRRYAIYYLRKCRCLNCFFFMHL